jgi:hypothetical protein
MNHSQHHRGSFLLLVLVFSGIFLLLTTTLGSLVFVQQKTSLAKENREKALQFAETGLEYYKWFLAHFPGDLQNGTGSSGPYVMNVSDPESGIIGSYSLEVSGNVQCGILSSVDITSTGKTTIDPSFMRTIFGRYARPSVAEYAYILNSNVWAGSDRIINGKYHSNGGIHMDGTVNANVLSSVTTWLCTPSFGCNNPNETKPGVWGSGPNQQFWQYPVPQIDFAGISADLVNMKTLAQASGRYFGPSGAEGYHVVFNNDGSFNVFVVTATTNIQGNNGNGPNQERSIIASETLLGNYSSPPDCGLIFVEDTLWVEGVVQGKKSIIAAEVTTPNVMKSVWLPGNITYTTNSGSDGIMVLGEQDVLISLNSPDVMTLQGIFIAQNGRFGRNHYTAGGSGQVPPAYGLYVVRTSLTIVGTIVSNLREGTKWTSGNNTFLSGYQTRINAYDRKLATNPPPLTPYTSSDYRFVEWREE